MGHADRPPAKLQPIFESNPGDDTPSGLSEGEVQARMKKPGYVMIYSVHNISWDTL